MIPLCIQTVCPPPLHINSWYYYDFKVKGGLVLHSKVSLTINSAYYILHPCPTIQNTSTFTSLPIFFRTVASIPFSKYSDFPWLMNAKKDNCSFVHLLLLFNVPLRNLFKFGKGMEAGKSHRDFHSFSKWSRTYR